MLLLFKISSTSPPLKRSPLRTIDWNFPPHKTFHSNSSSFACLHRIRQNNQSSKHNSIVSIIVSFPFKLFQFLPRKTFSLTMESHVIQKGRKKFRHSIRKRHCMTNDFVSFFGPTSVVALRYPRRRAWHWKSRKHRKCSTGVSESLLREWILMENKFASVEGGKSSHKRTFVWKFEAIKRRK